MHSKKTADNHVDVAARPAVRSALAQLLDGYEVAALTRRSVEHYAIEEGCLLLGGSSAAAIRWLVENSYVQQVKARTQEKQPHFRMFANQLCFVLTGKGVELARAVAEHRTKKRRGSDAKPHWDARARELWLGKQLVKQFRRPAINQVQILEAFEEEGWPRSIDDPLPGEGPEAKKRLENAIQRLNYDQVRGLLRFESNGNGDGIRWEAFGDESDAENSL